jgi:molybdopterin synthase catalytic subunit
MHDPRVTTGLFDEPLDSAALVDAIRRNDCGGIVLFEGCVRTPNQGNEVMELFYEAYEERATAQLRELATSAVEQFDLGGVVAVHRVGSVQPGEPAVVVAAAAAHRDAAFAAASWLIEAVKSEVAVWKKEITNTGDHWVGINH